MCNKRANHLQREKGPIIGSHNLINNVFRIFKSYLRYKYNVIIK